LNVVINYICQTACFRVTEVSEKTSCKMASGQDNGVASTGSQGGRDFILEVCRESLNNRCRRPEALCRYAHAPSHIQVIAGKVQCCVDYLKVMNRSST